MERRLRRLPNPDPLTANPAPPKSIATSLPRRRGALIAAVLAGYCTVTCVLVVAAVGVRTGDAKVQLTAAEATEQENVMGWLKPFDAVTVRGMTVLPPAVIDAELTDAREKSAAPLDPPADAVPIPVSASASGDPLLLLVIVILAI